MPDTDPCEICGRAAHPLSSAGYDGIGQACPLCGHFWLSGTGQAVIRHVSSQSKVKLSGWVRDQNMIGEIPELTNDRIQSISATSLPGIIERADRLLTFAIQEQNKLGETFNTRDPAYIAVTYSKDVEEAAYFAQFLHKKGLIELQNLAGGAAVTPNGYERYEQLRARQSASAQGFVAMWFEHHLQEAYSNGFEIGIRQAGYDPLRIDRTEHVGKIDDEIIAQIRRSRFVVADFTGHRGGVYFEAGFALGLDLPVIWTCHQDSLHELHFDIRQFNCIDWSEPAELADRLQKRIEAVIGGGPRKPLPS